MSLSLPIADALRRGATIVAANSRAARALQLRFASDQRTAGHSIWPTPPIVDWASFLRSLWIDHAFVTPDAPMLLTPLQERTLWTRIQRDDNVTVVSPGSLAQLTVSAWSLLSAWNAHATRRQPWGSADDPTDAERFRHWAAAFDQLCSRRGWLSASLLESTLAALLPSAAPTTLPAEILLVGFDRVTPAQRLFLDALEARHVSVTDLRPKPAFAPASAQRSWIVANDLRDEIAACAAWARDLLAQDPAARIAIIVPAVDAARGEIDRTFRRILMPATEDIRQPSSSLPWEFSLGQSLAQIPVIRAALLLLRWIAGPLPEEQTSWLMLSGFVANTVTNHRTLAEHDTRLRRFGLLSTERSLASYRDSVARIPVLRELHFGLTALSRTTEKSRINTNPRHASTWADLIPKLLDRVGWPGLRPADSVQFQALQRWQRLLDELALLDFDLTRYSWNDFLDLVERQAGDTIFSPESQDAPIQILGPFESSGQQFDALWFMGADDTAWPQRGRLHPLVPPTIQRQIEMPHATPEDDWNLAHTVTARLLNSAPRVVFSSAQREKDAELRPSPLIASLFPACAEPQSTATAAKPAPAPPLLEQIADDSGVLPWPLQENAGGSGVLKSQAACPFQAFASKRLRAEPLDENEWGISPSEKGKLLHEVMERLFSSTEPVPIRSRDDIVTAIATNQLEAILAAHIDAVLAAHFDPARPDPWQQACVAAEKRRLLTRIGAWLEKEAGRQPFTVEHTEQSLPDVHIGDLRLKLRADRIDLLPDGSRLLLDYKTGLVAPAGWEGDRPGDPQLPLYAAYGNVENVSGILFARIRAGKIEFEGCVRDANAQLSPDIGAKKALVSDPYSLAMRDEWARALEALAREFLAGDAAVAPQPHACDFCRLRSLCRVAELDLAAVTADDTDEEDSLD
ncbi:MAG TPA: PD-(D/E)XK nuclease family protein [Acidobacteriaceae bacterium]|jgi:probable DNA repair protein|nr:PD-(D/E)XK nuclease family protein [Acidobacteriaceae bacterium]